MIFKPGTDLMNGPAADQERLTAITATAALGQLALHDPAPVVDQPGHEDRDVAGGQVRRRPRRDGAAGLLDGAAPADAVPGVANVAIWGDRWHVKQASSTPSCMKKHNVTLEQVMEAAGDAVDVGQLKFSGGFEIGTGGFIDTPNQRLQVQHQLPALTGQQLAEIPIEMPKGASRSTSRTWPGSPTTSCQPSLLTGTRSSTTASASCSSWRSCPGATPWR